MASAAQESRSIRVLSALAVTDCVTWRGRRSQNQRHGLRENPRRKEKDQTRETESERREDSRTTDSKVITRCIPRALRHTAKVLERPCFASTCVLSVEVLALGGVLLTARVWSPRHGRPAARGGEDREVLVLLSLFVHKRVSTHKTYRRRLSCLNPQDTRETQG